MAAEGELGPIAKRLKAQGGRVDGLAQEVEGAAADGLAAQGFVGAGRHGHHLAGPVLGQDGVDHVQSAIVPALEAHVQAYEVGARAPVTEALQGPFQGVGLAHVERLAEGPFHLLAQAGIVLDDE